MALNNACLISSSSGFGSVTLLIHILPLIPGSFKLSFWTLEIVGWDESTMKDLRTLIVSAERKSQNLDCSVKPKVWARAVLPITGTFGMNALSSALWEASILVGGKETT